MQVRNVKPRVGSEVTIDRDDFLSGKYAREIEQLMVERSALVFRDMHLTDEEQVRFASTIGSVVPQAGEAVSKISMDPKVSPVADYTRGAFYWHIDGANDTAPAKATMLTAKVLADEGGDTLVCNTYAAWDDLPDEDKALIAPLRVRHALESSQRMVNPTPTVAELARWQAYPSQSHPIAWKHQHGRTSLVLGATAHYVENLKREEGDMLLCRLAEFATQEEYVYRHQWQVGDFLIWDNTGTMHRAADYALSSARLMHRTTLQGEEPLL